MSGKIVGATVGSTLPKPNLMQTDPTKGDYVKGKEEFIKQFTSSSAESVCHVSYNLVNAVSNNYVSTVNKGDDFEVSLTALDGYAFTSVKVIHNGEILTDKTYDKNVYKSTVSIKSQKLANGTVVGGVQGDIVVIAVAELVDADADLTGYATEQYVKDYAQPKGNYLTEHQSLAGYAKTSDIPTKPEDIGAQPSGNYALKSEIPSVPVQSVNGKTGAVSLSASDVGARPSAWMPSATDVGALPSTTKIPAKTSELTNDSGFITGYTETDPTVPSWAKASSKPSYSKSEVGLGNVDNVKQYSASNPPPYPVTSVNGKTGAVSLSIPTVPTKVSAFTNDAGYLTQHQDISHKANKQGLSLGVGGDGLVYLFVDGVAQGNGLDIKAEAVAGDVVGYVDSDNTIILTGALADGTYTFKYEDADGGVTVIGDVVIGEQGITNLIDTVGYTDGVRYSASSHGTKSASGYTCTGAIQLAAGDILRTSGVNFNASANQYCNIASIPNANPTSDWTTTTNSGSGSITTFDWTLDSAGNLTITAKAGIDQNKIRLTGYGSGANLIVTKNQEIV